VKLKLNLSLTAKPMQLCVAAPGSARKLSPFALLTHRRRKPVRLAAPRLISRPSDRLAGPGRFPFPTF
jgi:hypothetical protein